MMFLLEINFHWSEEEIRKMPADIVKKRIEQLIEHKKEHPEVCPFMAPKK